MPLHWLQTYSTSIELTGLVSATPLSQALVSPLVFLHPILILPTGFMCSLRFRERHRFSTRPLSYYDCYLQHWTHQRLDPHGSVSRGSDGNLSYTSVSCSPISSVLCHYGVSDGTHCSADVAEGFVDVIDVVFLHEPGARRLPLSSKRAR